MAASVAASHGGIRALVNCANIAIYGPSETLPAAEWQRQVNIALSGLFYVTQACARRMIDAGGGAIVKIASVGGMGGWPMRQAHKPGKAGGEKPTQLLGTRGGPRGIPGN